MLVCNSPSKIIEPVRSRCLGIRIPAPSMEEIATTCMQIAKKENIVCPMELAMKIASHSDRNLRRALLMLETCYMSVAPTTTLPLDMAVQLPDWELYIAALAREILQEQSPSKLLQARDMMYDLLVNCIPADVILSTLTRELMKSLDDTLKHEIAYWAAYYETRICRGSKDIFHLEAFVAKFMAVYKKWIIELFG